MNQRNTAIRAANDLTEGPIVHKILLFALPVIASNLLQQLYNAVDSIVIGQYAGAGALAAVGVSNPIMMLFNALFMGFSTGASIVVAQYFGAKNLEKLRHSINTTFSLAFAVGLVITILGVVLCKPLLHLLNVPDNVIGSASLYLTIIFTGTVGNVFFNYGSGILRGMGDSRWPLISLAISCVLNIVLDVWFVFGFGWGVAGVAIATVIGQTLSGLVLAWRIHRFGHGLRLSPAEMLRPDWSIISMIVRLGLPSGLQQMAMSLGGVITQSFTNRFGTIFIAANTVVQRVDGFVIMPMFGLSISATTFSGQNIGAGKIERAKKGINRILAMMAVMCIGLGVGMYFFGQYIAMVFTTEIAVIAIAKQGIQIICFVFVFMGLGETLAGAMRGAGAAVVPMISAIISNTIRIPLVYILAIMPNNYLGVFYTMALSMMTGALMMSLYYRFGKWQEKGIRVSDRTPAAVHQPDDVPTPRE
ncbi:MAG: MATE family efflux transporter [Clostridiales bacterium]|nr:MATE family efflux transporter [Clostridiales bacterium]